MWLHHAFIIDPLYFSHSIYVVGIKVSSRREILKSEAYKFVTRNIRDPRGRIINLSMYAASYVCSWEDADRILRDRTRRIHHCRLLSTITNSLTLRRSSKRILRGTRCRGLEAAELFRTVGETRRIEVRRLESDNFDKIVRMPWHWLNWHYWQSWSRRENVRKCSYYLLGSRLLAKTIAQNRVDLTNELN